MRCSTCMLNNPPKKASLLAQKTEKKNNIGISKFHSLFKVILLLNISFLTTSNFFIIIFSLFSILFIIGNFIVCFFMLMMWGYFDMMLIWCYVIWWVCWVYWYDVRVVLWLNSVKRGRYFLNIKINFEIQPTPKSHKHYKQTTKTNTHNKQ